MLAKTSSDDDGIDDCSSGDMFKGGDDNGGAEEEEEHMMHCSITSEQVFTVNDDSLFLFKTTMKQLVNAASVVGNDNDNDGNLDDQLSSIPEGSSTPPYNYNNGRLRNPSLLPSSMPNGSEH